MIKRLAFSIVALAILAGCRIQVSTTAGGTVTTQSGNYSCTSNAPCASVEVENTNFDETFLATPDAGFRFAGWRRRNRGFCGGSTDSCRLFTSGFAGNETLLAFLEGDETFFLEAVFEATSGGGSGGGSGTGNASACWNDSLVSAGSTSISTIQTTADGETIEFTFERRIEGGATFNGQSVLAAISEISTFGEFASTSRNRGYYQVPMRLRIRNIGTENEVISPASSSQTATFEPFRLERFDLAAGDSFTQNYTSRVDSTSGGFTFSTTIQTQTTIRFDGIETVTVPAGTFEACRFTENEQTDGENFTITSWYGVGNGVLIQQIDQESESVLVSASVNGADI